MELQNYFMKRIPAICRLFQVACASEHFLASQLVSFLLASQLAEFRSMWESHSLPFGQCWCCVHFVPIHRLRFLRLSWGSENLALRSSRLVRQAAFKLETTWKTMTSSPEVALGVALIALVGVLITALIAVLNARKRGDLDRQLLEVKASLDKLNSLELAKVQAEHSTKLKAIEQDRASQMAGEERRRNADAATLASILSILDPDRVIAFLRNHDFGGIYDREETEPLSKFLELSRRPDAEFLSPDLEQLRKSLAAAGKRFSSSLALNTHPRQGTYNSVLPESLINEKQPPWVDENAKELNDQATEFVEIFERLVRQARAAHVGC